MDESEWLLESDYRNVKNEYKTEYRHIKNDFEKYDKTYKYEKEEINDY